MICPTGIAEYFCGKDWTTQISLNPQAKFDFTRRRYSIGARLPPAVEWLIFSPSSERGRCHSRKGLKTHRALARQRNPAGAVRERREAVHDHDVAAAVLGG